MMMMMDCHSWKGKGIKTSGKTKHYWIFWAWWVREISASATRWQWPTTCFHSRTMCICEGRQ